MIWKRWFQTQRNPSTASSPRTPSADRRVRLGFERLEDRTTPSTSTTLLSFQPPTTVGNGPSQTTGSTGASFSADGNLVVFSSDADNLAADDTNFATDIFLADLSTGTITRISVGPDGEQGDNSSFFPSISADGRSIAFQSYASNLVDGDFNGTADIFVKHLDTGEITLVSADAIGTIGDNFSSQPVISANGSYVVFSSNASNLTLDDGDAIQDVFRKNLSSGAIDLVSASNDGTKGNQDSGDGAISADGAFVAFASSADNLFNGDTNGFSDIFRKNFVDHSLILVSADDTATIGNGGSVGPAISADGDVIAFTSAADNLVAGDTNGVDDVFVKTITTGATMRVSIAAGGGQLNGASNSPSLNANGRFVAFASDADSVVDGDTNFASDVFVRDLASDVVYLASRNAAGIIANSFSATPALRGDGRALAFTSDASNLTAMDTESWENVYLNLINQEPTISIVGDSTVGTGQSLSLNASGTSDPENDSLTFAWDLNGDGDFSDASGPIIDVAPAQLAALGISAGIYHARLRVTDAFGSQDVDTPFTILTAPPVIVTLNAPSDGFEGSPITFTPTVTASGNAGAPGNLTYSWTVLKDGEVYATGSAHMVSFTPDDDASYSFTLNVTDPLGAAAEPAAATIVVYDLPPDLNIAPDATADEGTPYTLSLAAIDPGTDTITSWIINWGDGSAPETLPGTATSASHVYGAGPANWTLDITATDENGTYFATQNVAVRDVPPSVALTGNASTPVQAVYTLHIGPIDDPGHQPVLAGVIDWGDSTTTVIGPEDFGRDFTHSYSIAGDVTILMVIVTESGNYDAGSKPLQVFVPFPSVALSGNASVPEGSPFTLNFGSLQNIRELPINGYRIDWGDGDTFTGNGDLPESLNHTYAHGPQTPTITVSLLNNGVAYDDPSIFSLTIDDVAPTLSLDAPDAVDEGTEFTIQLGPVVDPGDDEVAGYVVDWGDGNTSAGDGPPPASLTHVYSDGPEARIITVSLTNGDETFAVASWEAQVTNRAPAFDVGEDAELIEGDTLVRQVGFTDPGDEVWTATVDYGDGDGPQQVTLVGQSLSLNHRYGASGTFHVDVTIDDGDEPVTHSFQVHVANAAPAVTAGDDAVLSDGGTFTREGSFTDPGDDEWTATVDFGDGSGTQALSLSGKAFSLQHIYTQKGDFTITVTISDGTSSGVDTMTIAVSNTDPEISITPGVAVGEGASWNSLGHFTDADDDSWTATVDYGDGGGPQPLSLADKDFLLSHSYTENGTYTVTVSISDGTVTRSATTTATVNNVAPTVSAGGDASIVFGQTISRVGTFTDPGANTWTATVDYGDGDGAVALALNADKTFTLNHTYAAAGAYTVTVTIDDGVAEDTSAFSVSVVAFDLSLSKNTIVEQSLAGSLVGIVSTSSPSLDSSATFTLLEDAGGRFRLDGRNLVVKDGSLLSFASATTHTVRVRVSNGGATFDKEFAIQVVEGDKGDDLLGRDPVTGRIFVARSTGSSFTTADYVGAFNPSKNWVDFLTGDFDGNGFDDAMARDNATGEWWLAKNAGGTYVVSKFDTWAAGIAWANVMAVDMNGDGKADILGRNSLTGVWRCSFSHGLNAESDDIGTWNAARSYTVVQAIDLNHDGRLDLVGLVSGTGQFVASFNQSSSADAGGVSLNNLFRAWATLDDGDVDGGTRWVDIQIADVDGDGHVDFLGRAATTALWYVCYGTNGKPAPAQYLAAWARGVAYAPTFAGDLNDDGTADLIGRLQSTGQWVVAKLPIDRNLPITTAAWGPMGFVYSNVFVGDFNRDGKADVAGLRAASGAWSVGISTGTEFAFADWDTWPTNPARLSIRRAKVAI